MNTAFLLALILHLTCLEEERNRLSPIAAREHCVALVFAIICGLIFFVGIILLFIGSIGQAIIMMIASSMPGFISKVFRSRENNIEKRLKEIISDLRRTWTFFANSNLGVVPIKSGHYIIEEFTKKIFKEKSK